MSQPGFFDLEERYAKLDEKDPLIFLNETIDWEGFRHTLEKARQQARGRPRKNASGRKPFDAVLMFKMLILQHLYNLSDVQAEFQVRDRYSFCRFLGLQPEAPVPDGNTLWDFREKLVKTNALTALFEHFNQALCQAGYQAQKGQIIDASFVDVPRQRNSGEENAEIKSGEPPESFTNNTPMARQKDTDARWAKKNQETHYGYKNHISIDNKHKLIRRYEVSAASVHDSQVFDSLLAQNTGKDVWADSAYCSQANEKILKQADLRSRIHQKAKRNKALSAFQKAQNMRKSSTRARVEHVFGSISNEQGGMTCRVIGLTRNAAKIGLMNLVYNMRRFASLERRSVSRA